MKTMPRIAGTSKRAWGWSSVAMAAPSGTFRAGAGGGLRGTRGRKALCIQKKPGRVKKGYAPRKGFVKGWGQPIRPWNALTHNRARVSYLSRLSFLIRADSRGGTVVFPCPELDGRLCRTGSRRRQVFEGRMQAHEGNPIPFQRQAGRPFRRLARAWAGCEPTARTVPGDKSMDSGARPQGWVCLCPEQRGDCGSRASKGRV